MINNAYLGTPFCLNFCIVNWLPCRKITTSYTIYRIKKGSDAPNFYGLFYLFSGGIKKRGLGFFYILRAQFFKQYPRKLLNWRASIQMGVFPQFQNQLDRYLTTQKSSRFIHHGFNYTTKLQSLQLIKKHILKFFI